MIGTMHLLAAGLILAFPRHATAPVTIQSLLHEMADRTSFARLPETPFKQLHASSYDRAQTDPNDAKTWFANADYGQFIRKEQREGKTEWVVLEHNGPGAITHIWTPLLGDKDKMLVRFYFDGSDRPSIEEPFNDLMRGKSLIKAPFAFISWPEKGVESGVGSDLYYPIPFAKGCKVTMSEVPFYYSFDYRAYASGTKVETFSLASVGEAESAAKEVGHDLALPKSPKVGTKTIKPSKLGPGKNISVRLPKGPLALAELELRFEHAPDLQDLRTTIVEMRFDGERTVWCPIGDFFGGGVHDRPVEDRYRKVGGDGSMSCRWTMPYQKTAEIRIHNLGSKPISFNVISSTKQWKWDDRSLHFHGTWRSQYPLATRPFSDWNYLSATGTGVYVGDTLTVFSPVGAWYGEGDERVYVDGEKFPSHLGTGTEDYYGYAWGMAEHFSSPFIAMPEKDLKGRDNWSGFTTTSRIRGLDAIPFDHSLKFDMEIWDWADCKVGYSATTFWYARPGAISNRLPMPKEASEPLPEWSAGIKGAIECETMKVLSKSDGVQVSTQSGMLSEGSWSNNTQLFLQCTKLGDSIELQLPVSRSGKYRVLLYATKSFDYGMVRFSLDGHARKNVDLWSDKPIAPGPIDLGVFDLKQGDTSFKAEVVGTNARSRGPRFYFGLDCLVLKPISK